MFLPQGLAHLVYGCAHVRHVPSSAFQRDYFTALLHKLPRFNGQDLANTMWGMATLHGQAPSLFGGPEVAISILAQAHRQLSSLKPQELSCILWASATFGYTPHSGFMQQALRVIEARSHDFNAQELSNITWSLARFQLLELRPAFVAKLFSAVAGRGWHAYTPQGVTNILVSLERLSESSRPPKNFINAALDRLHDPRASRSLVASDSVEGMGPLHPEQLGDVAPAGDRAPGQQPVGASHGVAPALCARDYCTTVSALSSIGHVPRGEWLASFMNALQPQLVNCQPGELVAVVHALSCLRYAPAAPWMEEFLEAAVYSCDQMRPRELAMLLTSLADLSYQPSGPWLKEVLTAVDMQRDSSAFHARELVAVLTALGRMNLQPNTAWLESMFDLLGRRLHSSTNSLDLVQTVRALQLLQHRPSRQWLQRFGALLEVRLPGVPRHQVPMLLTGIRQIGDRQGVEMSWLGTVTSAHHVGPPAALPASSDQQEGSLHKGMDSGLLQRQQ